MSARSTSTRAPTTGADQVRYQWIGAKASLGEPETAVDLHRERAAAAPGDVRELRLLSLCAKHVLYWGRLIS